ncbi:MAG: CcmD family protein [Gemmatimonadota bacterium]|nr:CcmD family protein [Gemmatimonadota bacterium]
MNNPWFLVAGYGITFVTILAYLLHLRRREKDVEREP